MELAGTVPISQSALLNFANMLQLLKKPALKFIAGLSLFVTCGTFAHADGGMYPITMLKQALLKKKGLSIDPNQIYDTTGRLSLIHGVVQIGGCTGSFISSEGIILTNHHCAFSTLQPYSSPENNLMEKGYLAEDKSKELKTNLSCRIMVYNADVSKEIVSAINSQMSAAEKRTALEKAMKDYVAQEQKKHPGYKVEISEMLPGKSYILFHYQIINDVRIVYIPARNIGEFGGESDNWVWPRHNADFAFMRAYVSPTGEGVSYNEKNVPYRPKMVMQVNASGAKAGDFVMIWGYPGRTFRNQPARFVQLHREVQLPFINSLYNWQINTIKEIGKSDPQWAIRQESRIKSLANVEKNYAGKIKTLDGLNLVETRKTEEQELVAALQKTDNAATLAFVKNLAANDQVYNQIQLSYLKYLWESQLLMNSPQLRLGHIMDDFNNKIKTAKNKDSLRKEIIAEMRKTYREMYWRFDTVYLRHMLAMSESFKGGNAIDAARLFYGKEVTLGAGMKHYFTTAKIWDSAFVFKKISKTNKPIFENETIVRSASLIYDDFIRTNAAQTKLRAEADALLPEYVDIKMKVNSSTFIPDANSTLRVTSGNIKGFSPVDGMISLPLTTLDGMIAKEGNGSDYVVNEKIKKAAKTDRKKRFGDKEEKEANVCILYNTDTSGGNSGSPVLNDKGQIIGLNFDRAFEATVNDYEWNDKYSRSIGVDIRFVLWTALHVGNATNLINELNIVAE